MRAKAASPMQKCRPTHPYPADSLIAACQALKVVQGRHGKVVHANCVLSLSTPRGRRAQSRPHCADTRKTTLQPGECCKHSRLCRHGRDARELHHE